MSSRPLLPTAGDTPDRLEEAQFRARVARVGPDPSRRRGSRRRPGQGGGFRLGWKGWLAVDSVVVLLVVAGVMAWPPVLSCRHQEQTIGFYAGDSIGRCIRRGIADRLDRADQRLKSLMRGSGR